MLHDDWFLVKHVDGAKVLKIVEIAKENRKYFSITWNKVE
jgi:hypothetical protein